MRARVAARSASAYSRPMTDTKLTPLSSALALHPDGARYLAQIAPDWGQGRATFGGLIGALGVRAMQRVSEGRPLRSFTMNFVAPAGPGELAIEVEQLRAGRALISAQARLIQDQQVVAVISGAFGDARPSPLTAAGERAPQTPGPASLTAIPYTPNMMPVFTQHIDMRWASGAAAYSGAPQGKLALWLRARDAEIVDEAVLVALVDAIPSPLLPMLRAPAPLSTATWLVTLIGEPVQASPDAFWLVEGELLAVHDGYAAIEIKVWDEHGELRATSQQMLVEFSKPAA
jgi:acyl-CoA thioesterase